KAWNQPRNYFKRIRMVSVKRPRSDCLFFCPGLGAGAPGSGSQWPEQAGQNTRLLPPANRSTCTQSSQKAFSQLTHLTMARASRWFRQESEPSGKATEAGGDSTFRSGTEIGTGSGTGCDSS